MSVATSRARVTSRRSALITAVLLLSGALVAGGGASAQPRSLAVTPATELANQVVQVSWTGFNPTVGESNTVTIYQCTEQPRSVLDDCSTVLRPPSGPNEGTAVYDAITRADGTGSALIEVRPAQQLPTLDCSADNPCSIVAFENDGAPLPAAGLPTSAATAPLRFAPSAADCPPSERADVRTEGSASAAHALYTWAARVCTGTNPLDLDYTETNSIAGRRDFLNGSVDVGLTSSPATVEELAVPGHRSFAYAPLDITGVAIGFNVTDTVTHERIPEMNLTPRLVAMLIAAPSPLHLFQDPEFAALNGRYHWPTFTQAPLLRGEQNADTLLLTGWLQNDRAARAFLDGNDPNARVDAYWKSVVYPTDIFEARNPNTIGNYNPRTGTLTNARRLFNFQAPGDGVAVSRRDDGILGVMDIVTARQFGFPVARLQRANAAPGDPFVAPDAAGLQAGLGAMKANADGVTRWADVSAANGAYPLVKLDYAMVPTSGMTAAQAQDIARFLDYVAGDGQREGTLTPGYVALTDELRAQTLAARDAVLVGAATPTPAPSPAPVDPAFETVDAGFLDPSFVPGLISDVGLDAAALEAAVGAPLNATAASESTSRSGGLKGLLRALTGSGARYVLPALLVLGLLAGLSGPALRRRARRLAPA
jgi:hypothetical protein